MAFIASAQNSKKKLGIIVFFLMFILLFSPLSAEEAEKEENEEDLFDYEYLFTEGSELTVVSSSNTTQQMETIYREDIEKTHAADLPSLLKETLDLVVTSYGPYGNMTDLNLRGFSLERIAILVDGVPVNSSASSEFDFYSIDPSSIEKIEVIHGGSDTKFNVSGALGGVINFITIKKPAPGWSFGGSLSNTSYVSELFDTQKVNAHGYYGNEKYSFRLNIFGNRAGNHFTYSDYKNTKQRREGNEVLDAGASTAFIWNFENLSKLVASGSFYMGDKNLPTGGYSFIHAKQKDTSTRENLIFEMPRAFHDDFSMETSLSHIWKKMSYDPGVDSSLHNEHTIDFVNRWNWYPKQEFTLRFGGDYRFIYLDSTNTKTRNGHRGGLFITSEYYPLKNFLLVTSIKGMANILKSQTSTTGLSNENDSVEIIPVPKLGFSWAINDYFTLKNNYFRSFKFPDFNDLYWIQSGYMGNPDLKNEDGWGADLSLEYSGKNNFNFYSTFYGQWIRDSIHWSQASGSWRPENSGEAAFFGFDNKIKYTLPFSIGFLEKPVLGLNWIFQLSWLLNENLTFADSRRIPYMPMHTIGASLELPWKTGSFLVSGHFESSRYTETGNITKLDPCFLLNLTYNQKLNKNLSIFGKINNVLNSNYVSFADYPMPGINITMGINMNLSKIPQEQ